MPHSPRAPGRLDGGDLRARRQAPSWSDSPLAPSDDVITAAVGGDRRAAAHVLTSLVPRVGYLVRYLMRGDHDSEDISQEALVAILRGLGTFRSLGTLQSWADRVVVRATFAFIRRRRAELTMAGTSLRELKIAASVSNPDAWVAESLAATLLGQLPRRQREALFMHYVLEMSIPEIAEQLAEPPETIRSRIKRGTSRLRKSQPAAG